MSDLDWHKIDVPPENGVYECAVSGKRLCLVLQQGQVTVTSRRCPHAGADLSQGWCESGKLVCPFHRHRFDLQTGKGDEGQGNYIQVYTTKFENNTWYVGLPKSWWNRIFSF